MDQLLEFLQSFVSSFFSGLASSYTVVGIIFLLLWVVFAKRLRRFRIQLTKRAGWEQIKEELINGMYSLFIGGITAPIIFYFSSQGWVKIYLDTGRYGIWYELLIIGVIIIISDTWFYWVHRLLHHPKLYRYFHAVHHESLDTTPFTSFSFHAFETFIINFWIFIAIFIFPISLGAIGVAQILGLLNNIKSHMGYEFYPKWFEKTPLKFLINSTHHNQHHTRYNGNYGLFFTFWDQWFGTEFDNFESYTQQIKERKMPLEIIDNSHYHTLTISKLEKETEDTVSVYFEPTDPKFYEYIAGQYINLRIKVAGKTYDRIFSLSSSPTQDKFLRISVKKHSVVTHHFYNKAQVGDTIKGLRPYGEFVVNPNSNNQNTYIMIAGGSGITPLYSMIRSLLSIEKNSKIVLLYANRSEALTLFNKELVELTQKYSNFKYINFISGQSRIDQTSIDQALSEVVSPKVFVCGPEGLKVAVKHYLLKAGVGTSKINEEDYADGYVGFIKDLQFKH
jgi:ring-1,2-phenylacetyl-CoA epoxidase subunit PaaE